MKERVLFQGEEIQRAISRIAHEIVEKNGGAEELVVIGIRSRGAHLAERLSRKIEDLTGTAPYLGVVDISPYRDDAHRTRGTPESEPPLVLVSVDEKTVVLVDDVIYTGRTIRAALDMLSHLGRPKRILVAILVDRGQRELPIKADIVGKNVQVSGLERVYVRLEESDGVDQVTVAPYPRQAHEPLPRQ